jgi:hypothetical protein
MDLICIVWTCKIKTRLSGVQYAFDTDSLDCKNEIEAWLTTIRQRHGFLYSWNENEAHFTRWNPIIFVIVDLRCWYGVDFFTVTLRDVYDNS